MKWISKFCFFFATVCFLVAFFLMCIDLNSFNPTFFKKEYVKLNTAEEIGMSQDDLDKATTTLLDYIQAKRDDLNVVATIDGIETEVFNEKEKLHMIDVRVLYLNAMQVKWVSGILGMILLVIGIALNRREAARSFFDMASKALLATFSILFLIGLYAVVDFNSFWLQFHYIFFTNDLFLLNPATDILIKMVPSQFFFDLVFRIVISFALGIAIFASACVYERRRR
ncbi:MAG: TIGR01906 family membrane protein [Anaerorhabdus sp.]